MTDELHTPTTAAPAPPPPATTDVTVLPPPAPAPGDTAELPFGIPPDRPEILVGGAFAGGFLAAIILKRLGGS
jgi:hypothetical protein